MSYYDIPSSIPITPPIDDYGFPSPSGFDRTVIYRKDGSIKGVDFYKNGIKEKDVNIIEGGLFDLTIQNYYHAWRRFNRLNYLVTGPIVNQYLNGDIGQLVGSAQTFARVFSIEVTTSDGFSINVEWNEEDENPFSDYGLKIGCAVFDARTPIAETLGIHKTASVAQITDIVEGELSATVSVNKKLNINRQGKLWCVVESNPCHFPKIRFRSDENETPWFPNSEDITRFWMGRGNYMRETGEIVQDVHVTVVGRDDCESIGQLIGLPGTRYLYDGLLPTGDNPVLLKDYPSFGIIRFRTGEKNNSDFEIFENFEQSQGRLGLTGENTDNYGILPLINKVSKEGCPSKKDPDGGSGYNFRTLRSTSPGYIFEKSVNLRRLGSQCVGEVSSISGNGEAEVQRARPKTYISRQFIIGEGSLDSEGETRLDIPFTYKTVEGCTLPENEVEVIWQVPGYCDTLDNPRIFHEKEVLGTVSSIDFTDPYFVFLEFELGKKSNIFLSSGENITEEYDSGGNCVCPELCLESSNIASNSFFGDRQRLIVPGDLIKIGSE